MSSTIVNTAASIAITYALGYQAGRVLQVNPEQVARAAAIEAFARPIVAAGISLAGFKTTVCKENFLCATVFLGAAFIKDVLPTLIGRVATKKDNERSEFTYMACLYTIGLCAAAVISYASAK